MALGLCTCRSAFGVLGGMHWSWCEHGCVVGPEDEAKGDVRGVGYEAKPGGGRGISRGELK
jgi:hypothetical protein